MLTNHEQVTNGSKNTELIRSCLRHHHIVLGVDRVDRLTYTISRMFGTRLLFSFRLAPSTSTLPALVFPRPTILPYLCVVPYAGH